MLRGQVTSIISGSIFLFLGCAACAIAAMRRRSGMRALFWLGVWSAMYGARPLVDALNSVGLLPRWFAVSVPYLDIVIMYLIIVAAMLAWLELSLSKLRHLLRVAMLIGLAIGVAGISSFLLTGANSGRILFYNNLLAVCVLSVLVIVIAVPRLAHQFLLLRDRGVLLVGTLAFAIEALYTNLSRPLGYRYQLSSVWDSLGFAALLLSFGYVALQMIFVSERRLLSLESELAIARDIQTSILPQSLPELNNVRIAAAYRPMTAVAGDFYEFIPLDPHRAGFLVADVTGHGVPAALIASMIKVAAQSVVPAAHDPREVLRSLNRLLSSQLHDQFVTAAYLWLDTRNHKALYSAAGHPPLLLWRDGNLERIESNGLLFGVVPDSDYPVREISVHSGDRFLLYTDGITEPENLHGDSFGDHKLEQIVRDNRSCPPAELVDQLLSEICIWCPPSVAQQDDLTLIVLDIL